MKKAERERFDKLLERVLETLPASILKLLDEAPLVVEDEPSQEILKEFGLEEGESDICGLYTGRPLTERSVDDAPQPADHILIFRQAIVDQAGGWEPDVDEEGEPIGGAEAVAREIRITVLHEIGHHFGLDEDDLAELGYE